MTPHLIIAAVIAATGFGAGWHLQTLRYTAKERDREQQELAQVRDSAAASIRRADNVILAQNQAAHRTGRLLRDLGSSRTELDRLRAQLAQPVPGAGDTATACADRADSARELLAACAGELQEVAGAADRHASDALMLLEAWPK